MQAEPADRSIITQPVLRLLRMVPGKDDGNVGAVEEGGARRVHPARKPSRCVPYNGIGGGDCDLPALASRSRTTLPVDRECSREYRGNGIIETVDHRPVEQVAGFGIADEMERVRICVDAVATREKQSVAAKQPDLSSHFQHLCTTSENRVL